MGLGLTPNQAKVYQTIQKLGNATVIQIAKSSSVRREDVYKVLSTLEKMGLVEKLLGKPAIIRAKPVAGALASLVLDEKVKSDERIASMKAKFQALSKAKWRQPIAMCEEESIYSLLPGGKATIARFTSSIISSKSNVLWIDTPTEILHLKSLLSAEIKRAIQNQVKFKLIIEDFRLDEDQKKQMQHTIRIDSIDARFNPQPLNRFKIFDDREAMISANRKKNI